MTTSTNPRKAAARTLPKRPLNRKDAREGTAQILAFKRTEAETPTTENGKVPPPRRMKNSERRSREYLTPKEVDALMDAAKNTGRHGHRDATLILIAYRHGFRVSELVALRWDQVDLGEGLLHVSRIKNGSPSTHPLRGPEIRALRRLKREYAASPYVFTTERRGPLTASTAYKVIARAGERAKLAFPVHPHMLRHVCGFTGIHNGHDTRALQHYLGHKNIQHTVRYTELAADRFNGFWKDRVDGIRRYSA